MRSVFPFFRFLFTVITALSLLLLPVCGFTVYGEKAVYSPESEDTVFLGDSTTNSLCIYGIIDRERIWTGPDNTLSMWDVSRKRIRLNDNALQRLKESQDWDNCKDRLSKNENGVVSLPLPCLLSTYKPKSMVITLGVNGICSMDKQSFLSEYRALIETVKQHSPQTKVILNVPFPVGKASKKVTPNDIIELNSRIKSLAEEFELAVTDISESLMDNSGYANPIYQDSADGLHYGAAGCRKIKELLFEQLSVILTPNDNS